MSYGDAQRMKELERRVAELEHKVWVILEWTSDVSLPPVKRGPGRPRKDKPRD